ncbi:hypothetical protein [Lactiplantibacillus herbarum]|uniref:hypothetical protein n=1 Tax=Lactiplantibacillus herbarum TaxID=1670446 RepID=UPI00128DA6CD|nr:hypothetical protein [Lactiplantibacillus herbarum]
MEIGPLSEWVAAAAEILAVSVALFLPYYNQRQERLHRLKRFKKIVEQSINVVSQNNLSNLDDFQSFIKISSLLEVDERLLAVLQVGDELIEIIDHQTTLSPRQITDVLALKEHLSAI